MISQTMDVRVRRVSHFSTVLAKACHKTQRGFWPFSCLTINPNNEASAPFGDHFVPVVLVGEKLEVDSLGESSNWLIASVSCDPFMACQSGREEFIFEYHSGSP